MIASLLWKEYREHRAIWIAMALLAIVTLTGATQILMPLGWKSASEDAAGGVVGGALILTAMYGLVCGAMMFAGERESQGMGFLDALPISRVGLWWGKCLIGIVFSLLYCVVIVITGVVLGVVGPRGVPIAWTLLLPLVVLETYAWSLLASTFCRTVLTAVALAALLPVLLLGLCSGIFAATMGAGQGGSGGGPILLVVHSVMTVLPLFASLVIFSGRQLEDRFVLKPSTSTHGTVAPKRQPRRLAVLVWLVLRQGGLLAGVMCVLGLLVGLALPAGGSGLWPLLTLLLGVLCGAAVFMGEQNEGAFKFWGDQRLPVGWLWLGRSAAWAGIAVFVCILMLLMALLRAGSETSLPRDPATLLQTLLGLHVYVFDSGGTWAFVLMWLLYGFAYGQICTLVWRKSAVAVVVAVMTSAGTASLWLPSLIGGGLTLVQVLGLPLLLLLACRLVLWDWVTGRLKTRPAVVRLASVAALGYLWLVGGLVYRVVEVPGGGEPFDRPGLKAHLANPEEGRAGQAIRDELSKSDEQEPLAEPNAAARPAHRKQTLDAIQKGWSAATPRFEKWLDVMTAEPWPTLLARDAKMPLGVFINPNDLIKGPPDATNCRRGGELLTARALQLQERRDDDKALEHLATVLALSRHLRHWAPAFAYREGVETEDAALTGLGHWLKHVTRPELLHRALGELKDHEAATPPVTDALAAEYFRFRGSLGSGVLGRSSAELESLLMQVPWEAERAQRLTDALFAGRRRFAESKDVQRLNGDDVLADWQPAADGPTPARMEALLGSSWLNGSLPVTAAVQRAALLSQCRIRAARLQTALTLYQLQQGKPAQSLDDLVPGLLPELPDDPFTHGAFPYRVSLAGDGILTSAGLEGREFLVPHSKP